jgi:hypothetical protein
MTLKHIRIDFTTTLISDRNLGLIKPFLSCCEEIFIAQIKGEKRARADSVHVMIDTLMPVVIAGPVI